MGQVITTSLSGNIFRAMQGVSEKAGEGEE